MFQWMMALATALSTMLAAAGMPADVTPAQVMNGEAMAQVRTALQVAAQNRPEEMPEAAVMARLQNQVRAMIREAQGEGLDEPAMEQLMERVRERLQLQLEQCEDDACQFGLEQALQATEQWRNGYQSRNANGSEAPGGPVQGDESGPPADAGGPGGSESSGAAGSRGAGGGGR